MNDEPGVKWFTDACAPRHVGPLVDADRVGHAVGPTGVRMALGVWLDRLGRVRRVRWTAMAATDALVAYAELACALLESGVSPVSVDASALQRTFGDAMRDEGGHAELVAAAVNAALCARPLLP